MTPPTPAPQGPDVEGIEAAAICRVVIEELAYTYEAGYTGAQMQEAVRQTLLTAVQPLLAALAAEKEAHAVSVKQLRRALEVESEQSARARTQRDAAEDALAAALADREGLAELVRLADDLYVVAAEHAQAESRKAYQAEFGHDGPSLAGFLPGGADRNYHYARHTAGECPLPSHARFGTTNLRALATPQAPTEGEHG